MHKSSNIHSKQSNSMATFELCDGVMARNSTSYSYLIHSTPLVSFVSLAPDAAFSGKKHRDAKLVKVKTLLFRANGQNFLLGWCARCRLPLSCSFSLWSLKSIWKGRKGQTNGKMKGLGNKLTHRQLVEMHFWRRRRADSQTTSRRCIQVIRVDLYSFWLMNKNELVNISKLDTSVIQGQ